MDIELFMRGRSGQLSLSLYLSLRVSCMCDLYLRL